LQGPQARADGPTKARSRAFFRKRRPRRRLNSCAPIRCAPGPGASARWRPARSRTLRAGWCSRLAWAASAYSECWKASSRR